MDHRFSLVRLLYQGPRSVVCAGRDAATGRSVAIKVSPNAGLEVDNMLRTVTCDRSKVAALVVDRPVALRELCFRGVEGAAEAIYARGLTQKSVIMDLHEPGPGAPPEFADDRGASAFIRPYFEAVAELHEKSYLQAHCDLKYSNFVVPAGADRDGRCLVDFELAQPWDAANRLRRRGTLAYMAPETLVRGEVSPYADAWALGIMLFQACHPGRFHPFVHSPVALAADLRATIRTQTYDDAMWSADGCPLVADLVARLLKPQYDQRPDVVEALSHPLFSSDFPKN